MIQEPMKFSKGKSGNPGGRRKLEGPLRDLARQYSVEAMEALVAVMQDKSAPPSARAIAADKILDRAHGKAPQPMDGDGEGGPIVHVVNMRWLPATR